LNRLPITLKKSLFYNSFLPDALKFVSVNKCQKMKKPSVLLPVTLLGNSLPAQFLRPGREEINYKDIKGVRLPGYMAAHSR
jgi:hypothetical protein